ncbi:hypothetical protein ILYODFUR_013589, partial [Ilyodon furcidens]
MITELQSSKSLLGILKKQELKHPGRRLKVRKPLQDMDRQPHIEEVTSMDIGNDSAASVSDGGMEKMLTAEGKKEEFLQETVETSGTTVVYKIAGRMDTEEKVEVGHEEETKKDEDEAEEDEEENEEEEAKAKKCLGHWESE